MGKCPIESIMTTTMENIRKMVDVSTAVGDAIIASNGSTIIPISKVCFGFAAGGGEYDRRSRNSEHTAGLPFAGCTGAGVTIQPVCFIVANAGQVRLLPAQRFEPVDRIIELIPQVMCELKNALTGCTTKMQDKEPSEPPPQ